MKPHSSTRPRAQSSFAIIHSVGSSEPHDLAEKDWIADETQTLASVARYGALGGDVGLALPYAECAVALGPFCFDCGSCPS